MEFYYQISVGTLILYIYTMIIMLSRFYCCNDVVLEKSKTVYSSGVAT